MKAPAQQAALLHPARELRVHDAWVDAHGEDGGVATGEHGGVEDVGEFGLPVAGPGRGYEADTAGHVWAIFVSSDQE